MNPIAQVALYDSTRDIATHLNGIYQDEFTRARTDAQRQHWTQAAHQLIRERMQLDPANEAGMIAARDRWSATIHELEAAARIQA